MSFDIFFDDIITTIKTVVLVQESSQHACFSAATGLLLSLNISLHFLELYISSVVWCILTSVFHLEKTVLRLVRVACVSNSFLLLSSSSCMDVSHFSACGRRFRLFIVSGCCK